MKPAVREYVPLELLPWSAAECADYLGVSTNHFMRRIACRPDFPKRMKFGKRWVAMDVIEWARG